MTISKKQQGFAIWEMLLILLVLLLLLLGAWFIWQKNKKDDEAKKETASQTQQAQEQEEQEQAPQTPEQAYLEIKEWGVRFQLAVESANAYYVIEPSKPNYAYLSTNPLKNTECAADKITTGVYTRFTLNEENPNSGEPYIQTYPNAPKVGNYYFIFDQPQAYCSDDPAIRASALAAQNAFKAGVVSVEATP